MSLSFKEPRELQTIYARRFTPDNAAYRDRLWKVLVADFFQSWICPDATVLDLGCGYGEFINHVKCRTRYAMDLNPDSPRHLAPDVKFIY